MTNGEYSKRTALGLKRWPEVVTHQFQLTLNLPNSPRMNAEVRSVRERESAHAKDSYVKRRGERFSELTGAEYERIRPLHHSAERLG